MKKLLIITAAIFALCACQPNDDDYLPADSLLQSLNLSTPAAPQGDATPSACNFYIQPQIAQDGQFSASFISDAEPKIGNNASRDFNKAYFGIAFTKVINGAIVVCAKITAEHPGEAFIRGDFSKGTKLPIIDTYTVYPFLCNQRILLSETTEPSGRRYMSFPNLTPAQTTIVTRIKKTGN